MANNEEKGPVCKCGLEMVIINKGIMGISDYYYVCLARGIFNFWKHTKDIFCCH